MLPRRGVLGSPLLCAIALALLSQGLHTAVGDGESGYSLLRAERELGSPSGRHSLGVGKDYLSSPNNMKGLNDVQKNLDLKSKPGNAMPLNRQRNRLMMHTEESQLLDSNESFSVEEVVQGDDRERGWEGVSFEKKQDNDKRGWEGMNFNGKRGWEGLHFSGKRGWEGLHFNDKKGWEGLHFTGKRGLDGLHFSPKRGWEGLHFNTRRGWEGLNFNGKRGWEGLNFNGKRGWEGLNFNGKRGWEGLNFNGKRGQEGFSSSERKRENKNLNLEIKKRGWEGLNFHGKRGWEGLNFSGKRNKNSDLIESKDFLLPRDTSVGEGPGAERIRSGSRGKVTSVERRVPGEADGLPEDKRGWEGVSLLNTCTCCNRGGDQRCCYKCENSPDTPATLSVKDAHKRDLIVDIVCACCTRSLVFSCCGVCRDMQRGKT